MYAGRVVESGTTAEIFADPRHPYTLGLLDSMPRVDSPIERRLRDDPRFAAERLPGRRRLPVRSAMFLCNRAVPRRGPGSRAGSRRWRLPSRRLSRRRESHCEITVVSPLGDGPLGDGPLGDGPLVEVDDLCVTFEVSAQSWGWRPQLLHAVDGVSFADRAGRVPGPRRRVGLRARRRSAARSSACTGRHVARSASKAPMSAN